MRLRKKRQAWVFAVHWLMGTTSLMLKITPEDNTAKAAEAGGAKLDLLDCGFQFKPLGLVFSHFLSFP